MASELNRPPSVGSATVVGDDKHAKEKSGSDEVEVRLQDGQDVETLRQIEVRAPVPVFADCAD